MNALVVSVMLVAFSVVALVTITRFAVRLLRWVRANRELVRSHGTWFAVQECLADSFEGGGSLGMGGAGDVLDDGTHHGAHHDRGGGHSHD